MTKFAEQCRRCLFLCSRQVEVYGLNIDSNGRTHSNQVIFYENYCRHPIEVRVIDGIKIFSPPSDRVISDEEEKIPCHFVEYRPRLRRRRIKTL